MITFFVALAILILGYLIYGKFMEKLFGASHHRRLHALRPETCQEQTHHRSPDVCSDSRNIGLQSHRRERLRPHLALFRLGQSSACNGNSLGYNGLSCQRKETLYLQSHSGDVHDDGHDDVYF